MLVGNGLDESDLKRCQAKDAGGVFIIPDRTTSGLESQDTMTTLLTWSLHLYAPNTRVFTYNLLPETETFQWGIVEQTMCISDVKQLLLAYSCRHRGTTTLILNLLHPSEPSNSYDDGWQAQYGDGTGNEFYVGPVPDVFVGWTFAQVSWFVYQEFQSILIGVDIFLKSSTSYSGMEWDGPHFHGRRDGYSGAAGGGGGGKNNGRSRSPGRGMYDSDKGCPSGQYHLTLNPGNSYRLGKYDQLIYIAQSPYDIDSINKFTVDQYERLVKDEKGHLDGSRLDFAHAMDMYYKLRDSRADAREAAKRRAEHRKGKRAKQADETSKVAIDDNSYNNNPSQDYLMPEKRSSTVTSAAAGSVGLGSPPPGHVPPSRPPSSFRSRSGGLKKARPAWNVALYDDDDDDDLMVSDSSSLQRMKSRQSKLSHQSSKSRNSDRGKVRVQDREHLIGALAREELITRTGVSGIEEIPLSDARSWPSSSSLGQTPRRSEGVGSDLSGDGTSTGRSGQFLAAPSPLGNELYPSTYDRNAAAAAAEDARNQGQGGVTGMIRLDGSTSPLNSMTNNASAPITPQGVTNIPTIVSDLHSDNFSDMMNEKRGLESSMASPLSSSSSSPTPTPLSGSQSPHVAQGGSIQGSFQTLDESTYIGQTSVTRSETKDLPLCHLLISPPDSIKPLIKDDLSSLKNHIVICSDAGENLYRFLATLRLAQISREDMKTIVVLTKNPMETFTSDTSVLGEMGETDIPGDNNGGTIPVGGGGGLGGSGGPSVGEGNYERCSGGYWDAILSFPRVYWVSVSNIAPFGFTRIYHIHPTSFLITPNCFLHNTFIGKLPTPARLGQGGYLRSIQHCDHVPLRRRVGP
jgi:hypothetical protein